MTGTISQIVLDILKAHIKPDLFLHKVQGAYSAVSTDEFGRRVRDLSLGLRSLGRRPGEKMVILADNGPDWIIADYANLCLGAVTVPIYPTLVPEQIRYIIDDSDASVVYCSSPALWRKLEPIRSSLPKVRDWIVFFPDAPPGALPLAAVQEKGRAMADAQPELFETGALAVGPDDLASIIYTSGTTGVPKGVMLTHANFASNITTLASIIKFGHPDVVLSFLPLSHVLERMVTMAFMSRGCTIAYAESVDTVAANLLEIRPHIMVSVPRLFEKLYAKIMDSVQAGSPVKRVIFGWAVKVGRKGKRSGLAYRLAHKLVFSKILEKTGGRVRFFVSGGAPLSKDIAEFFFALGLVVLEGYGLTETAPVVAVNTFEDLKFGTVGKPIPGVAVRIAPDGEILVKGPNVMKGYYKKDAETREAFDAADWFRTGDIGKIDAEGFLTITDRKKDLIVTAGGKNIAPQPIENMLKRNPYIANAVVIGGRRKFISALIVPEMTELEKYARGAGIAFGSPEDLLAHPAIRDFLLAEVDRSTPNLAPYEKVKKIAVLNRDFEIEREEMTPTLKIKRNKVEEKYKDLIDSLYEE